MNKRKIQAALKSCALDPNLPTVKVIIDSGNPEYFRQRAIEFIRSNRDSEDIRLAIFLLALTLENHGTKEIQ